MRLTPMEIEYLYPVVSVLVHRGGNMTVKRSSRFKPNTPQKKEGQTIKELSKKSRKRLNHIMQCTSVDFKSMATLTYGKYYPRDGVTVKNDLKYILKVLRLWSPSYLWFLEFQKRGAPHFHLLLTVDCITPAMRNKLMQKWVKRQTSQKYFYIACPINKYVEEISNLVLFNIHEKVWSLIKTPNGAKRYVAKYATKTYQKKVPEQYQNVGRFWGCSVDVSKLEEVEVDVQEAELRALLEKLSHPAKDYEILPRYLWGVT